MTKYKTPTAWKSNVGPFAGGSFSQKFMWKPFINLICLWLTCVNPWVWSSWPKKCIFMPSLKALQVFLKVYYLKVYFLSELWCHSGLGWWLPENWKCCGSNSSNQHGWWFGKSSGRRGLSIKKYIYIYIIYIYIYIYVYVYIHITYCDSHCDRK